MQAEKQSRADEIEERRQQAIERREKEQLDWVKSDEAKRLRKVRAEKRRADSLRAAGTPQTSWQDSFQALQDSFQELADEAQAAKDAMLLRYLILGLLIYFAMRWVYERAVDPLLCLVLKWLRKQLILTIKRTE